MRLFLSVILIIFSNLTFSAKVVNLYLWGDDIPKKIIHQFQKETGISVNLSSYDNNATMYAKLMLSKKPIYDIVMPSANYVGRMRRHNLLMKIEHKKLKHIKNIDSTFVNNDYDKGNLYSIPLTWGTSGIFYNNKYITTPPHTWANLWDKRFKKSLLLLDDSREVFAMALFALGYSPNDLNPKHIEKAYYKLKELIPNIKLFANEGVQATIIDGDALIGSTWNNDVAKARFENKSIHYIYPNEGFVVWVDNLAIAKNAPHPDEAYAFINFLLRPDIAAQISELREVAVANEKAKKIIKKEIRENLTIYPNSHILKRGYSQQDLDDATIALINKYWQKFKLNF